MKAIVCEMCNSNELVKQDGVYVCQHCGTKYSVEEAKKLMVDVQGTVNVSNMGNVDNYIVMAENAYSAGNNAEAENYCNKAMEIDTTNYQAWLIKGKAAGWQSTIANIRFAESLNCFMNAIKYAPGEKVEQVKSETVEEVRKLFKALNNLACEHYVDYPSDENANTIINCLTSVKTPMDAFTSLTTTDLSADDLELSLEIANAVTNAYTNTIYREYVGDDGHPDKFEFEQFKSRAMGAAKLLDFCIIFAKKDVQAQLTIHQFKLTILQELVKASSWRREYNNGTSYWVVEYTLTNEGKNSILDMIMETHQKMKELDPTHVIPARNTIQTKQGCYIATAVYGSYDCKEVWTLRRYRDYVLDETWHGRVFIKIYYKISPKIVKIFGKKAWFNKIFKRKLDKFVHKLNLSGINNTPYNDKY